MLSLLLKKEGLLRNMDPDHIYVENVRSFFNMPFKLARLLCEMAVKEGLFEKRIGLKCPNCHRMIKSYPASKALPSEVSCDICELNEEEQFEFNVSRLEKVVYYKLNR